MPYDLSRDLLLRDLPQEDGGKRLGPCLLTDKIGQGGMGVVYRGRHLELDREVAVKCLFTAWAQQDETYVPRFQREAEIAVRLRHPNLVEVLGSGEVSGVHFLVMELVDGLTVSRLVSRCGSLDPVASATIAHAAGGALGVAHEAGIVHRDVKPDNILISRDGCTRLTDLGLAKATREVNTFATASGVVLGSLAYMPPEQFGGLNKVGAPGDVYSLGLTLYFMLAGESAFWGTSPHELQARACRQPLPDVRHRRPDTPRELVDILDVATRKSPEERYPDAGELFRALDGFLSSGSGPATSPLATHVATALGKPVEDDWLESFLPETLPDEDDDPPAAKPGAFWKSPLSAVTRRVSPWLKNLKTGRRGD